MTTSFAISLRHVSKRFGDVVAVADVSLDIADGEFLTLLGPSGSGKTTVLRMIAGFELPSSGEILLNGSDVSNEPAFKRDVNTVFQDYALFPHMTVAENVEYGMRVRKVDKTERTQRRDEALRMVRLTQLADRMPAQLSGGQRQRVALARAIVNRPKVLLLDEPLGALDLKLREEMQTELKALQRTLNITFVYVTHDQGEALSMSDRIAVFNAGRLEQVGSPRDLYERPATSFVAGFVGVANLFDEETSQRLFGRRAIHTLRPERVSVLPAGSSEGHAARVVDSQYLGAEIRLTCQLDVGGNLVVSVPSTQARIVSRDEVVALTWDSSAVFEVSDS
ncbi:MAG: ABC transporter ATP-binding protein [Ilumatobacteraceae bacterium]|jgi:putative spermidine/putrescine transport system ATP-binding protein|nr:ABC transporter ATP-binding protein [Actinomycetota bacterium]NCW90707.1 ABC transporter ATP-binding protein [Acidimicrobiia bacterium]NBS36198.1 ABC transporter ATP-binding protein [Actinomycetota bacterium]NCX18326.1 ABC transporter ATP-binding protein [Acidimicrobiia bacterium]NCX79187.1 ABC transporter ATP-binding protein [Actinomycetota bacterium]